MSDLVFQHHGDDTAVFSEDMQYRYWLERRLPGNRNPRLTVAFIMLNPSTADAFANDPTVRRCVGYATAWGYGRLVVVNLFAWRATDPEELLRASEPIGDRNDGYIAQAEREATQTVAAWGANKMVVPRGWQVQSQLGQLYCLGVTKDGHPKHPLYLRKDAEVIKL